MSPEQLPVESLAVAFVVESSLAVAQEWRQVLLEYVQLLLKRLADTHPNFKLRIAFVSYGTADTLPSPLICKRFFADYSTVAKELKDALTNFGLGQINSGGKRSMAALEGLVATLELFDGLQTHLQNRDNFSSHVFHIAASPPDDSVHPFCNESPALDEVNWETLPLEIKKRNIHYTSINLRADLSEFSQLHSAAVIGSTTPWFNVRPSHTLLLAAFSTPPQQKDIAVKRPGETQTERTPDAKRPRLQTNTESPRVVPQALGTAQSAALVSNPIKLQPPRSPQIIPPPVAPPPRFTQQTFVESFRKVEERIQALDLALATARSEGKTEEAENILQDLIKNKETHAKFKQFYVNQYMARQQAQAQAQAQAHTQSHLTPNLPQNQGLPAPPFSLNGANNLSTGGIPTNQLHMQHARSLSNSAFQPPLAEPNPPNATATQIQKANELQTRLFPTQMSPGHNMGLISQNNSPSGHPDSDPASNSGFNSASGSAQSSQPEYVANAVPVWSGVLNWSGQGTSGKKEVCTYVIATSPNAAACHAETWPKALSLVPTRELGLSSADLHMWIRRFRPALCHLLVQPRGQDSKVNQSNFDLLVQLLRDRKLFATAAWTTPSGAQENNVLVFPVPPRGLMGAFFPMNGIPEMPKPSAIPIPKPMSINPLNLTMASQLQQFSPEQRNTIVAHLMRLRQQQQSQQPLNQDGTPINHEMQNHANMNATLRAMSNPGGQGLNMNGPPGFPRPGTNNMLGGVQGNLSYEMLQSFMQRNADGGMSMNQQG
ncbi:hypothetical protein BYT27DRAFT_7260966 [Phlegmacium glaucopus]|nr:hypothetical protein BYT27DRAFT_7260966 [Phlegmacium glaucopus]